MLNRLRIPSVNEVSIIVWGLFGFLIYAKIRPLKLLLDLSLNKFNPNVKYDPKTETKGLRVVKSYEFFVNKQEN